MLLFFFRRLRRRNLFGSAIVSFDIPPPKYLIFHVFLTVKSIYFHRNKCFKRLDFRFTKKIRFDFPQNFNILFGEISIYFFDLQRNFNILFRFTREIPIYFSIYQINCNILFNILFDLPEKFQYTFTEYFNILAQNFSICVYKISQKMLAPFRRGSLLTNYHIENSNHPNVFPEIFHPGKTYLFCKTEI